MTDTTQTTAPTDEEKRLIASTRRFDLRRILGGLFVVYGVIVFIVGLINNSADLERTNGIAINLWTGGSMLVLGILFFVWDRLAPVPEEDILRSGREAEAEKEHSAGD